MSLLERLARLGRLVGWRRALARILAVVASLAFAAAVLAIGARAGLLARVRWLPLAWWVTVVAILGALVRAVRRDLTGAGSTMRATARMVEAELALRRGALVGLVDVAGSPPSGTSSGLLARAGRTLDARLPARPEAWAPIRLALLRSRVRRRAAAGTAAVIAAGLALWYAGEAAATLVSPLRAIAAAVAPRVALSVSARAVKPGDTVTVTVVTSAPGRPTLYVRATGEAWRATPLGGGQDGRAEHRIADVRVPLFLYAALGGAVSDTVRVAIIEPLFVAALGVTASYPAYLGRQAEELDPAQPLVLPVGTVLSLRGSASAPLSLARLVAADTVVLRAERAEFQGALVVRGTASWRLDLRDGLGAALEQPPTLDVRAVPDSAPLVSVPVPGADTTAPLDLRPALVVDARDDHGLGRIEIVSWRVSRLGVVSDTVVDSLPGVRGADRIVQSQVLDLTSRGLLPGDTVRLFVRASDLAPVPHVGRSREFALRLRSMAEMREAVRAGGDSLAREAAALAAEQERTTRQTEDLAAQRNRAADPAVPHPGDPRAARERQERGGAMDFEQVAEAQRLADRQQQLAERAEALREELERLTEAAQEAGLNDSQWQQQLRNLEELMRQAITPELRQRLEELRRALERLDSRAVQEALRRLALEQRRMRDELQRSAELFERAAIEGSLQTFAQNAEALRYDQESWNQRAETRRDSAAAAAEQRQLRQTADSLARQLAELEQRLRERRDSAAAARVDSAGEQVEQAAGRMQEAAAAMQEGQRQQAAQRGRQAARNLESVPQNLEQTQRQMSQAWREEVLRLLGQSLNETVTLAAEEQRLAREMRQGEGAADARGRQSAVEQGISQLVRQLQEAAGRNALVSPRLGAALGQAREQVAQSRQALEGPSPSPDEAADRAQEASQLLSSAAFQLMRNRSEVGGAESGSGLAEAIERMAQLAGQQGQLNDQLGGLIPMLGSGQEALMQQLRLLAQRQRALANQLERLGESGMPGRPDQLAEEARQLADRLEQARLDRATLERQQRLFRRMLDAGRTLRNDDEPEDPERESRTAGDTPARAVRGVVPREAGQRFPAPAWSDLRQLSAAERAMVLEYFRRLNAAERP